LIAARTALESRATPLFDLLRWNAADNKSRSTALQSRASGVVHEIQQYTSCRGEQK